MTSFPNQSMEAMNRPTSGRNQHYAFEPAADVQGPAPLHLLNSSLGELEARLVHLSEMVEQAAGQLGCPPLCQSEGPVLAPDPRPMRQVIRRVGEMGDYVAQIENRLHEALREIINL